ncbi:MAG: hypothetical protein RR907_15895, partial [Comamonas sp.]
AMPRKPASPMPNANTDSKRTYLISQGRKALFLWPVSSRDMTHTASFRLQNAQAPGRKIGAEKLEK